MGEGSVKIYVAMAEKMNQDLVFDCSAATKDFKFSSRAFDLGKEDIL